MRPVSNSLGSLATIIVAMATLVGPCSSSMPTLAAAPAGDGTSGQPASFAELMARAEEQRAAWQYAESARAFTAAYDSLGEGDQAGLKGEIAVGNAVDDFQIAQEGDAESIVLFEEEAALLERYRLRVGALPAELEEELGRVKGKLDEHRRAQEEAAEAEAEHRAEAQRRAEQERRAKAQREAEAQRRAKAKRRTAEHLEARAARKVAAQREAQREAHRKAGIAILSVGLPFVGGGIALMASGEWNRKNVERRGNALLAELDASPSGTFPMRQQYRMQVDGWQSRWERIGGGMIVAGALTMTAGLGLTIWGALRVWEGKRRTGQVSTLGLLPSRHGLGIAVIGRY